MTGRIPIEDVSPTVSCGRHPAKAVVGETIPISATVYREGHDAVAANVVWVDPGGRERPFIRMERDDTQRWHGVVTPDMPGLWSFVVEGWGDPWETWRHAVEVKIAAGQGAADLANDLESGALLLVKAAESAPKEHHDDLVSAAGTLRDTTVDLEARVVPALKLADVMHAYPVRDLVTKSEPRHVWVDRERALFGSWYEFFPRSEGAVVPDPGSHAVSPPVHGTFRSAMRRLPEIAELGFDIVYLPPIHPIG